MNHTRTGTRKLGLVAATLLVASLLAAPAWAQYGRTAGGYGGGAAGYLAGTSVGTALVTAAGITNPLVGGAIVTTSAVGAGLAGARFGSRLGDGVDDRTTPDKVWSTVGAVTGSLMGFVFMPGGHIVAKVLGAGLGAAAGAWLGNMLAKKADRDFNPRTVGALLGGVNGALYAGPIGAAVGLPLGYAGGSLVDKYVFTRSPDPRSRGQGWNEDRYEGRASHTYQGHRFSRSFDANGYDRDGFDRQGFDRLGYDRDGRDREGYDRFGFDQFGFDRQGYDRKGYRQQNEPTRRSRSNDRHYDRDLYDQYWNTYSDLGGGYPRFNDDHWKSFPEDAGKGAQDVYKGNQDQLGSHRAHAPAAPAEDANLASLRATHQAALDKMQALSANPQATRKELEEALSTVKSAEQALNEKMKGN